MNWAGRFPTPRGAGARLDRRLSRLLQAVLILALYCARAISGPERSPTVAIYAALMLTTCLMTQLCVFFGYEKLDYKTISEYREYTIAVCLCLACAEVLLRATHRRFLFASAS